MVCGPMAGAPRRESASPVYRDVTKCGVYHSIHPRAILILPVGLQLPETHLPLTTVLRVVVPEPRLSRLLAFIQRHPFPVRQLPQPGKVPAADASLRELLFESLTLQTA